MLTAEATTDTSSYNKSVWGALTIILDNIIQQPLFDLILIQFSLHTHTSVFVYFRWSDLCDLKLGLVVLGVTWGHQTSWTNKSD